ncbi:MAG: right-handed parallel beta-helix repeat-containing protein, partial [Bacteroidales bacterium]|nr:right-handed parallel beta-helix repeat-containing protein [Bacteroidales bacterium]
MKTICATILALFFTFSIIAQTTIPGGDVSGTWTSAGSPYEINGNITLQSGQTLTIEHGVNVVFQDEYSFTVYGNLQANGIESDSIRFTVQDTTGFASGSYTGWNGLYFYWGSLSNNSSLEYCIVEFSKGNGINTEDVAASLINDCSIRNNTGNGVYISMFSSISITRSEFLKNRNNGIVIYEAWANLNNINVNNNDARGLHCSNYDEQYSFDVSINNGNISQNQDGGLFMDGAHVTMDSIIIEQNSTPGSGAGIKCIDSQDLSSSLTMTNSSIINNTSTAEGGGLLIQGSALYQASCNLHKVLIDNNFAYGGGGISCGRSNIVLDSVTISHNSTVHPVQTDMGGGIYSGGLYGSGCHITMTNSEITNNESEDGAGGVYAGSNTIMDLDRVTIAGNLTFYGGDIFLLGPGSNQAQVNIINSIVWDSFSGYTDGLDINYSDVVGTFPTGIGNINEDPLFTDPGNDDYTLQWPNPSYPWYGIKSPCIDSGDPASPTDADGTRADMGAHTFNQPNTPLSGTLANDLIAGESPYFVYGDLLVPSGETINIEDGVLLVFQDEYYFTVNGSLQANGIAGDSIRFTVPDTTGFSAGSYTGWNGLKFYWATGSSMFDHSIVEYSKGNGLYCESSNLEVGNSLIRKNNSNGIYIVDGSWLNLHNSMIKENKGDGLSIVYHANLNATNTTVKNNLNNGMYITSSCNVVLNDFISTGNVGTGVVATLIHDGSLFYSGGSVSDNMDGGILINDQSNNVTLENLIIQGNEKSGNGGGICVVGDEFGACGLTGNNLLIDNNSATLGGGIYCSYSSVLLDSIIFSNNEADLISGLGGGIYTFTGDLVLTNSSILDCDSWKGGGIYIKNTVSDLDNIIINDCEAEDGGGLYLWLEDLVTTITYSQITNNNASYEGGGVYVYQTPAYLSIVNTTMYNNQAGTGGNALITYSPFVEPSLKNCIVWGHNEPAFSNMGGAGPVSASYSDIQGTGVYPGTGNINHDPLFTDPGNNDFTLVWDNPPFPWGGLKSLCIDKGDPVSPPDPDGTRVDMGAYYYHQTYTSISGNINDTLKCADSPYYVFGDLTVLTVDDLVIEPCVHLIFIDDYRLNVEGRLQVIGNTTDSILFYPADTAIGWQGIRFYNQNTNGQDSSKLEFCKIMYAKGDGPGEDANGGGIYCNNSSELLINKSELSHNLAEKGGGIYCDSLSNPLISENILEYNQAIFGGGIYGDSSNFQLEDCNIRYNTATDKGGGIYVRAASSPLISDNNILNNTAISGGGIYADSSNCQVSSCFIQNNQATAQGGGIYCNSGSIPVFTSDTISYNESDEGGGL